MDKITVHFHIKALDSSQEFTTIGEYNRNTLVFQDDTKDIHKIVLKNNLIEYTKSGSVDLHFIFHPTKITKGEYTVYQHHFEFGVLTQHLEINAYDIVVKYKLLQTDEVINEATLSVQYEFL